MISIAEIAGDPAVGAALRLALLALFASAVLHKAADLPAFRATIANYQLLPRSLAGVAATALLAAELIVAIGLALLPNPRLAAVGTIALLATYSLAVAVNLARGRRDIDCGCLGPRHRQKLSGWLLLRNGIAIAGALALLSPPSPRPWVWIDFVSIAGGAAALGLLWAAANQLMRDPQSARLGVESA